MGLKSGSRDAGLNDTEEETDRHDDRDVSKTGSEAGTAKNTETGASAPVSATTEAMGDERAEADSHRPTMDSIPYKLRREKVNEGREQVPFFLREEVIAAEDDLQSALEVMLGEDVYKSDYREAAMIVAQRNPELVAEILREWGYDLDSA